jgi:hypothetical protein
MPRRPNLIPSVQLNLALSQPIHAELHAHLWSPLEQRVPPGAYQRFMEGLLRKYFRHESLDLAPWTGAASGALIISGPPEAIHSLKGLLS